MALLHATLVPCSKKSATEKRKGEQGTGPGSVPLPSFRAPWGLSAKTPVAQPASVASHNQKSPDAKGWAPLDTAQTPAGLNSQHDGVELAGLWRGLKRNWHLSAGSGFILGSPQGKSSPECPRAFPSLL